MEEWTPSLGAWCGEGGTAFRVWAPGRKRVEVVIETSGGPRAVQALARNDDGTFSGLIAGVREGERYRYRLDGHGPFPDPASRFQPEGAHGPSEVIDPRRFAWSDGKWGGLTLAELVIYELHVGTFTPAGTFLGVIERLPALADLGVTAVELMPVADFAGERNWGYDGVALFAPARAYGTPDDLRRLVDAAHALGIGVILDVVYNHFGPDGAYHGAFSPSYFSGLHRTPWGAAMNLDGPQSEMVRAFFIENARHWLHEYHFDGLRLDATHALIDDRPRHFLAELSHRVRVSQRPSPLLIAEDHRNLVHMVRGEREGGWGLDAVWADDFHHQVRRGLAGDSAGYYADYTGSVEDLATTVRQGWYYTGQHAPSHEKARGTDPTGVSPRHFVICLQNHDQIGNRAFGERLNHQIEAAAYRAASALLLCASETPLLFMGQEWAATTPFRFFTDHKQELGRRVTAGRRNEFRHFAAFTDPAIREKIPDPQALATFLASRLDWEEAETGPHAGTRRLYRALLHLRRTEPALRSARREDFDVVPVGSAALAVLRRAPAAAPLLVVIQWSGGGDVTVDDQLAPGSWDVVLSTEDERFAPDPQSPEVVAAGAPVRIRFARPGAMLLRGKQSESGA